MTTSRRIKCRFCDFTCPVIYRSKGGNKSGFTRLAQHIDYVHPAEYAKFEDKDDRLEAFMASLSPRRS